MRPKKEKTEIGSYKAVGLKRKKVNYGIVEEEPETFKYEGEYLGPESSIKPEELKATHSGGSGSSGAESQLGEITEQEESETEQKIVEEKGKAFENILEQILSSIKKDMEKKDEEEKENEGKTEEEKKKQEQKEEEEQKENRSVKKRNETLTEYLVMQLRLRALAEILGAVKVAEEGKTYYSFIAVEGKGVEVFRCPPASKRFILDFATFPYFDEAEKAQAFLELCHVIINRYCHLMAILNPVAVTQTLDIEVIHS